jgi:hypothetical protein
MCQQRRGEAITGALAWRCSRFTHWRCVAGTCASWRVTVISVRLLVTAPHKCSSTRYCATQVFVYSLLRHTSVRLLVTAPHKCSRHKFMSASRRRSRDLDSVETSPCPCGSSPSPCGLVHPCRVMSHGHCEHAASCSMHGGAGPHTGLAHDDDFDTCGACTWMLVYACTTEAQMMLESAFAIRFWRGAYTNLCVAYMPGTRLLHAGSPHTHGHDTQDGTCVGSVARQEDPHARNEQCRGGRVQGFPGALHGAASARPRACHVSKLCRKACGCARVISEGPQNLSVCARIYVLFYMQAYKGTVMCECEV